MKTFVIFLIALASLKLAASEIMIKSAKLVNNKGTESKLSILHSGIMNSTPTVKIVDKSLLVSIPQSGLAGKLNKKINGSSLSATMPDAELVEVRLDLPYSLAGRESDIAITLKEGIIEVGFPRIQLLKKTAESKNFRSPSIASHEIEKLDENYLDELTKKDESMKPTQNVTAKLDKVDEKVNDRVNLAQASAVKSESKKEEKLPSKFSIAGYVGKFVAFMAIMIAGFYGVLMLFKKGIIKKGKLGFLHSTKLVEVLSTTHIAPKKSLMMVKAHKQVFLIASSETGISLVSEIKDTAGIIKTGEEEITGSNFDTNLYSANKLGKQFKLKEENNSEVSFDLEDDYKMNSLDEMLNDDVPKKEMRADITNAAKAIERNPIKDNVKFSDQIKTKVKNLKQL